MYFCFRTDWKIITKSYFDFQNEVSSIFWKQIGRHNYKQIVFYYDANRFYPLNNDEDLKTLTAIGSNTEDIELNIVFNKDLTSNIYEAIKNAVYFHVGISCDRCSIQPIVGPFYRCFECQINLCEFCEADKFHSKHLWIPVPTSTTVEQNAEIYCDNCAVERIIGTRYKCYYCHQSFCKACNDEWLQCKDHVLIRCLDSGGVTAFGTLVSQTNIEDSQFKILNNKMDTIMELMTLMKSKVSNIDGDSAGKESEESHQQEDTTDESEDRIAD